MFVNLNNRNTIPENQYIYIYVRKNLKNSLSFININYSQPLNPFHAVRNLKQRREKATSVYRLPAVLDLGSLAAVHCSMPGFIEFALVSSAPECPVEGCPE